jgi:trans-aconitate methyltransferase
LSFVTSIPERAHWTVERLRVRPRTRVLEIGCGGGQALKLAVERYPSARFFGVDRSPVQVLAAKRLLANLPAPARPVIERLELRAAGQRWASEPFDLVFAINVNAFWTEPQPAFTALALLSKPRAKTILAYEPPSPAGVARLRKTLEAAARSSSFKIADVEVEQRGRRGLLALTLTKASHVQA